MKKPLLLFIIAITVSLSFNNYDLVAFGSPVSPPVSPLITPTYTPTSSLRRMPKRGPIPTIELTATPLPPYQPISPLRRPVPPRDL
jgi:hypothetical protein